MTQGRWALARMFALNVLQVTLISANVSCIAGDNYRLGVATSFLIQIVWWNNTSAHRPQGWAPALAYSCGGAVGVLLGMMFF